MPSTLNPIIYGKSKDKDFTKFNIGDVVKAVGEDLEEFGEKGVQGLPIKSKEGIALVTYEKNAKRTKEPYIQAGLVNNDLVLVVRDEKNAKFETMSVLVKNYKKIKEELANSTASVVNISPDKEESIIKGASIAQGERFGTTVENDEDDVDLNGITGNILLCAHGAPSSKPGRLIGVELGHKTPADIVKILTGNSDKKKRLAKDYSGKITLSGCFTASGGPEADKADAPFAQKVQALLKKDYPNVSVVGMPGPAWTARSDGTGTQDHYGDTLETGQKGVLPTTTRESYEAEKKSKQLRQAIDKATQDLIDLANTKDDPRGFLATPQATTMLQKIEAAEKLLETVKKKIDPITQKGMAHLTGTFGLRVIRSKYLGNK